VVSDAYQRQGLGTHLVHSLVEIARQEGLERLVASMLPENAAIRKVFETLGFDVGYSVEDQLVNAELRL